MGKCLDEIYNLFSNPGFLNYINSNHLDTSWLIEAGCHDGTDTLKFLADQRFRRIFAFEPDPESFELASQNLVDHRDRVSLQQIALMHYPVSIKAHPWEGRFGTGSTIFEPILDLENSCTKDGNLMASCLDEIIPNLEGKGALWLDVEGSALLVLQGASRVLDQIIIAQIEIDMHNQSKERQGNYLAILKLMKEHRFSLVAAPIHPGYFGDALFVKNELEGVLMKIRSYLLYSTMKILHSFVYPLLRKPKKIKANP